MELRYLWEIEFDSGNVVRQNNRPRDFDPQDPIETYGKPKLIRLVPITQGETIVVPIPQGCKPVCHRFMFDENNGSPKLLSYRIGYRTDTARFITSVDSSGNVTEIVDKC